MFSAVSRAITPPPHCGMQMLNANLPVARHKVAKQQNQNKKLFSDIAIGACCCDKGSTLYQNSRGLVQKSQWDLNLQNLGHTTQASPEHQSNPPPPPPPL